MTYLYSVYVWDSQGEWRVGQADEETSALSIGVAAYGNLVGWKGIATTTAMSKGRHEGGWAWGVVVRKVGVQRERMVAWYGDEPR